VAIITNQKGVNRIDVKRGGRCKNGRT